MKILFNKLNISLLKPHVYLTNINLLNFRYLKEHLGIDILIFDKDDTLTAHHVEEIHSSISPFTIKSIAEIFKDRVFICSNSRREWVIDYKENHSIVQQNKSFKKIPTFLKKPFNFGNIITHVETILNEPINPRNICILGDRILTDVLMAQLNGCLSVYLDGFNDSIRSRDLERMRELEQEYLFSKEVKNVIILPQFYNKIITDKIFN